MSATGDTSNKSKDLVHGLPRDINYIPEDLKRRAISELFEDEDAKIYSLRLLRSMLKEEHGLIWYDEDWFLIAVLRARKFDVKRAFHLLQNFYTTIGKHDELYYNFHFDRIKNFIKENSVGSLPTRDHEGCVIILMLISHWNPVINPLSDMMLAITCGLLQAVRSPATQIAGFKVIVDFNGCTLKLLPHISPTYIILCVEILQNMFPARFRGVHIVNETRLFSYIWIILKRALTKKMRDRFYFHGKNIKELHEYLPRSILPADYEGDLPAFDNREWGDKLEEHSNFYLLLFSKGYEKYRIAAQKKNVQK